MHNKLFKGLNVLGDSSVHTYVLHELEWNNSTLLLTVASLHL